MLLINLNKYCFLIRKVWNISTCSEWENIFVNTCITLICLNAVALREKNISNYRVCFFFLWVLTTTSTSRLPIHYNPQGMHHKHKHHNIRAGFSKKKNNNNQKCIIKHTRAEKHTPPSLQSTNTHADVHRLNSLAPLRRSVRYTWSWNAVDRTSLNRTVYTFNAAMNRFYKVHRWVQSM